MPSRPLGGGAGRTSPILRLQPEHATPGRWGRPTCPLRRTISSWRPGAVGHGLLLSGFHPRLIEMSRPSSPRPGRGRRGERGEGLNGGKRGEGDRRASVSTRVENRYSNAVNVVLELAVILGP